MTLAHDHSFGDAPSARHGKCARASFHQSSTQGTPHPSQGNDSRTTTPPAPREALSTLANSPQQRPRAPTSQTRRSLKSRLRSPNLTSRQASNPLASSAQHPTNLSKPTGQRAAEPSPEDRLNTVGQIVTRCNAPFMPFQWRSSSDGANRRRPERRTAPNSPQ